MKNETTIEFKMAIDNFSGLYRLNGRGAWKTQYTMDSLLQNGTYQIVQNGKNVGKWIQGTCGHFLRSN